MQMREWRIKANQGEADLAYRIKMGALSDPKLEKFAQALLVNLAHGMPRSKAAAAAARTAGYSGSSVAANARRRAGLPQVKARIAELARPAQQKAEQAVVATVETAMIKLSEIAFAELGDGAVKVSDQIAAFRAMAQMHGWNAPEKTNLSGELKIGRIERVIVEPTNRDGGGVPPPVGEGEV
jgi:hypothetical protein